VSEETNKEIERHYLSPCCNANVYNIGDETYGACSECECSVRFDDCNIESNTDFLED
jgi:hypothetical protein